MDGYLKDSVIQRKLRKVPPREKKDPAIGKTFFDPGDYEPGVRNSSDFIRGEFTVLCRQPGEKPTYWCERNTNNVNEKRDIQQFGVKYVRDLIDKYDKE